MEKIVSKYLIDLGIPISKMYCERTIVSHPNYPSLLSIADTLEQLGIAHKVIRVEKKDWSRIQPPYLFQLKKIDELEELQLIKNKEDLPSVEEKGASAFVIKSQPTHIIRNQANNKQYSKELLLKKIRIIGEIAVFGILLLLLFKLFSWIQVLLLCSALSGFVIGYLLIAKEIGITYETVEKFCKAGTKTSCDKILDSNAAKIFMNISLSDMATSYFLFQTLIIGIVVPLSRTTSAYYFLLLLFATLTVPIVLYSLYYQMIRAQVWCRLCLFVDAVLIFQLMILIYMFTNNIIIYKETGLLPTALSILFFTAIGSGIILFKRTINSKNKSTKAEALASRIKNNPEVFSYLLSREKQVDVTPFDREVIIGNPDAPLSIKMAASLGCKPCRDGYFNALELISAFPQKIRLSIRFRFLRTNTHNPRPTLGDKSIYLLWYWNQYIYGKKNESEQTKSLLSDWYKTMEIEEFIKRYPRCADYEKNDKILDLAAQHTTWFEESGINETPNYFIFGYELPNNYQIIDLMPLVPDLIDFSKENMVRMAL